MGKNTEIGGDQAFDLSGLCRKLVDDSPLSMAAVEGNSHILRYVNPAFCRLVGKDCSDLIGRPFAEAVPEAGELVKPLERVSRTGESETIIEQRQLSDQHPAYWSCVLWPVSGTDAGSPGLSPLGVIIQPTDTTETALFRLRSTEMNQELLLGSLRQHELTETSERAVEALAKANADLGRSNKDLEQFAYVASHDLQEPLRAITGHLGLLARKYKGKIDEDADEFIRYAVDGAKRLSELIDALLTYSRIGRQSKPSVSVDPEDALRYALEALQAIISESNAVVTHDPLPLVRADEGQLAQVFQNLIGNAIKFRREEEPPRVHISARPEGENWMFFVSDNGIGIEPKHQKRVFDIFEQLHGPAKYGGSGMGLAICKRIIEGLGGEISMESQPGKGTTFFFTLPKA